MERDRPPRSGIPTFVGSNGRVQGQEKGVDGIFHVPGRVDSVTSLSSFRKDKSVHSSPRPQRNGHYLSNGHVDVQDSGFARLHSHNEHQSPSRNGRVPSDGGGVVCSNNSGHNHITKQRIINKRTHVAYAHTKRNDYFHPPERDLLERSIVGCESGQNNISWTLDTSPESPHGDSDKLTAPAVDLLSNGSSHTSSDLLNGSLTHDGSSITSGNVHLTSDVASPSASVKNSIMASGSTLLISDGSQISNPRTALDSPVKCESESSTTYCNVEVDVNSTRSTHASIVSLDYPILGTISPLTNKGIAKRSVGPVDEVPFVFGRPASPTNEHLMKCSSPQTFPNPGIARCMSPSPSRYMPGHYPPRSMSPNSDILPRRKGGSLGGYPSRRVLSPPPVLGVGAAAEPRMHHQGGICCEHCNGCLVELKRQALRLMFPDNGAGGHLAQSIRVDNIGDRLTLPDGYERWYSRAGHCGVCETPLSHLKQEAVAMIQSIQLAQTSTTPTNLPSLVGSCGHLPHARSRYHHSRQGKLPHYAASSPMSPPWSQSSMPLAAQAQAYLEQNVRAYINPQKYSQMLASRTPGYGQPVDHDNHYDTPSSISDASRTSSCSSRSPSSQNHPHYQQQHHQWPGYAHPVSATSISGPHHVPSRGVSSASPTSSPLSPPAVPSAAVSFFARAAQKLGKKKKRHHSQDQEPQPSFPTNFAEVIRLTPPAAPPCLLRTVGRLQNPGMGKVKVMLKICHPTGSQGEQGASFLSSDPRKKQVTVFDPSASGYVTSANRRAGTSAPKMFAFDSVVTPDDSLTELCASSLAEIVQAVVAGADGCVFTYGYSKLGKTYTMIGSDQSPGTLGVMPCAIAWLFKLINEQKDKTGARFSVRVSAVQVTGKEELLRDLLSDIAQAGAEATGAGTAPSVYLREDPICGTQLENQSELRAPTADKAAFYLDAALASCASIDDDDARSSHLLFTLNVYQYRIEKANTKAGLPGVAGGRSRLHLIDLGTSSKSKDPSNVSLSLSALGNVIMALLNGQRHVPHRDSKIAQLLRDSLGNLSCRTCMIAHVSSAVPHYNETLQVIQLAARIHRMKRRRTKFSSTSSEDSSTDGDVKFRRPYRGLRMGTLREDVLYSSSHSDPDYTSSSEQSCDTVIYIGANGQSLSDRELTDNEGPPRHVPRTNPRLPRRPSGSRSSGDDSDSGRSMHSVRSLELRLPARSMLPTSPLGPTTASRVGQPPGSPNPGLVKMGHIVGLYGKTPSVADGRVATGDGSSSTGNWQEKPSKIHCHSSQSKMAKAIHEKQQPLDGELWIDGPGATVYPESKCNEMWVDGPQAFVVQQQQQQSLTASSSSLLRDGQHHHHHHHTDSSTRRVATKKVDAEEQWIDGPKEMLSGSNPSQPMHTCSKSDLSSKPICQNKTCGSIKLNEKALKQALLKHMDATDISENVAGGLSSTVEVTEQVSSNSQDSDDLSKSLSQTKSTSDCSSAVASDIKQVDASSSPMVSTKKPKLSESPKKSKQSPKPSPTQSPSMSRRGNKTDASQVSRLQKSQLPGSASPTHRVVQWIKSVSSEQELADARRSDSGGNQQGQNASECVSMADAETNTEHDSEFERLAEENEVISDSDDDGQNVLPSSIGAKCETFASNDFKGRSTAVIGVKSNFDASMLNRESIYEIEVEERLELMKTKDGSRLAAEVDNETFSSVSCSNKDSDDLDRNHSGDEMESLLIQHTKTLTESKQTSQLARHLARGHSMRNVSPSSCDYEDDTADVSRPLLSRKPDGASNPNLQMIFFEEESVGKNRIGSLPRQSVKAMFVSASQSDSGVDFPTTSSKSLLAELEEEDTFCESDINTSPLFVKGDGSSAGYMSSTKLGAKNKPPLPSRTSPTLKQSGLPKLTTNSQPCTNSSPTRSVYCLAKPTRSGKDSQNSPQKASPSGKNMPLSSPTIRSKFARGDKASCSSSTTSHSPQSSATSSPLVSVTSKSSSSSPAPKAASKSLNGSTSKLPSFCSARTSSPSTKDSSKSRKKDKDFKGSSNHANFLSDFILKGKGNDSDSGNDSGIVAHEKRLLSPYATVTKPRTPSHSSSGHGSDNSTISTEVHPGNSRPCTKTENLHGGTSSGYESMLRDSEATGSSSGQDDSGSESSSQHKKGSKRKGTRRSRSAPARSPESSPVSSQPSQAGSRSVGPTHRVWVDTRHLHKVKDEPLELKRYDPDEVERLGRRRTDDENKLSPDSKQKDSSTKMDEISIESSESKDRIDIERHGWSFDCRFLMCFSCKSRQRGTDV